MRLLRGAMALLPLVLAAPLAAPAYAAGDDPAGVLPGKLSGVPPLIRPVATSSAAYAMKVLTNSGFSEVKTVLGAWDGDRHELPGHHLLGLSGTRADLRADGSAVWQVTMVDAVTGGTLATATGPAGSFYLGSIAEGAVYDTDRMGLGRLVVVRPDGATRDLAPGLPSQFCLTTPCAMLLGRWALDDAGVLYRTGNHAAKALDYLDFATGETEHIGDGTLDYVPALSAGRLAWAVGTQLFRRPRAGGAPVVRTLPVAAGELAVTDAASAWRQVTGGVLTAAEDPAGAPVPLAGRGHDLSAGGTGFHAVLGTTAEDAGLYGFATGATEAVLEVAAGRRPAHVAAVQADIGQIVYRDDSDRDVSGWRRDVAGGTAGPEEALASPPGTQVLGTGELRAVNGPDGAGLADAGASFGRLPYGVTAMSGYRALAGPHLYQLNRGAPPRTVPDYSALWGPYLYASNPDGSLTREDLSAPGTAPLVVVPGPGPRVIAAGTWGDWAHWRLWGSNTDVVRNVATGVDAVLPEGLQVRAVGDGVAVGRLGDDLVWADLTAPGAPVTVLDTITTRWGGDAIDVHGRLAVWRGDDRLVHWRFLDAAAPASAPRVLDVAAPPSFSPDLDGTADDWAFRAAFSAPVPEWTLVVTSGSGAELARSTGTAPHGGVIASWDGRGPSGRLPGGTYSWRLTAGAIERTGTVEVTYGVPRPVLTTPPVVTGAEYLNHVTWRPGGGAASSYQLLLSRRLRAADGRWFDEPWRLLAETTGHRVSVRMPRGATWRFVVRGRDLGGVLGPGSAPAYVTAPLDDAYAGLVFSPGWGRQTARALAYERTETSTLAVGGAATVVMEARQLGAVLAACPDCGRVEVLVDGRRVAVVDTYAPSYRASSVVVLGPVTARNLPRRLLLRNVGPRRRLVLDAVVAVR